MKRILQWVGGIALAGAILVGAAIFFGRIQVRAARPSAEVFVTQFYILLNDGEYRRIYDQMGSSKFRQQADYVQFEKFMRRVAEIFGKSTGRDNGEWGISWYAETGTFFTVRHSTARERGKTIETFTLERDGTGWKLLGYYVYSPDLLSTSDHVPLQ